MTVPAPAHHPKFTSDRISHRNTKRLGFALIIALSLMSFLVLLILGLTSIVRIQTQSGASDFTSEQARQNAIFSMQLALAELDFYAGPDQRVTARADINSATVPTNRGWTGVWDANPFSADFRSNTRWLISYPSTFTPSPNTVLSASGLDLIEVVSARNEGEPTEFAAIEVPLVPIGTGTNPNPGRFAWWVGDEGVKSRFNLPAPTTAAGVRETLGLRPQPELNFPPTLISDYRNIVENSPLLLDRLLRAEDLRFLATSEAQSDLYREAAENLFHDISAASLSLLTDTRLGGLRQDLTRLFERSTADFYGFDLTQILATDPLTGSVDPLRITTDHPVNASYTFNARPVAHLFTARLDDFGGDQRVPGPTWNLLRNYALLYRNVTGNQIAAQRSLPRPQTNHTELGIRTVQQHNGTSGAWHNRILTGFSPSWGLPTGNYPRLWPTTMKIHPVVTEVQYFLSWRRVPNPDLPPPPAAPEPDPFADERWEMQLVIDPIYTIWNPYSVDLDMSQHSITAYARGFPVRIEIEIDGQRYATHLRDLAGLGAIGQTYIASLAGDTLPGGILPAGSVRSYSPNNPIPVLQTASQVSLAAGWNQEGGYFADRLDGYRRPDLDNLRNRPNHERVAGSPTSFGNIRVRLDNPFREEEDGTVLTGSGRVTWGRFYVRNFLTEAINNNRFDTIGNNKPWVFELMELDITTARFRDQAIAVGDIPFSFTEADPGEKVFFGRLSLFVNAEDEIPVPLGIQSPLAYTAKGNIANIPDNSVTLPAMPVHNVQFAEINALAEVDGRFGPSRGAGGSQQVVIYDIPRAPLHSIAQFQHADHSAVSIQPMHAIGNSRVPPVFSGNQTIRRLTAPTASFDPWPMIDTSYLANEALWDRYFFSTLTDPTNLNASTPDPTRDRNFITDFLQNPRAFPPVNHRFQPINLSGNESALGSDWVDSIDGFQRVATHLGVRGGFNINSTSVAAWRALLASTRDNSTSGRTDFSRFTGTNLDGLDSAGSWNNFRQLNDTEINEMANRIVGAIRARGVPFYSLSEFVNRTIGNTAPANQKGLLQRVIDDMNLNTGFSRIAPGTGLGDFVATNSTGRAAMGAPSYLQQADILTGIGSVISARSDTFRVRAYGEASNPSADQTIVGPRFEAIVQRVPTNETDREFRIVEIRYLDLSEI
jgi:hypothetical protein